MKMVKFAVGRLGIVGSASAAVVALAAGTAVAYWVTTGTGSATAQAGTAQNPTTSAVAVSSGLLVPGGTGDVYLKVNNPNAYAVRVTAVTGSGTVTASGGSGTCTTTAVTFTNQTPTSGNTIAAGSSATFTYTGAVAMGTNPDQGCQGATFTIPVSVTISS
ncbi:MAG TPA: hypothetical protein VJT31_29455 [Rugosimonospora sp.]|nr:hypothetical protein [Rugosimonospora sp.]